MPGVFQTSVRVQGMEKVHTKTEQRETFERETDQRYEMGVHF